MKPKKPGPKPSGLPLKKRRSVCMSDAHWQALETIAKALGLTSASAVVCELIEAHAPSTASAKRMSRSRDDDNWEIGA